MAEITGFLPIGQLQDMLAGLLPQPSSSTPSSEANDGMAGTNSNFYAQEGHRHPRLTSTTVASLAADGTATVNFTRMFTAKPGVVMTEIDSSSTQPLVMVVQSFVMTAGFYSGAVIKGYRSQALPAQSQMSLASLLTAVVTGINNIASSLTGFNVFGGSTAGSMVSVIAVARSDM